MFLVSIFAFGPTKKLVCGFLCCCWTPIVQLQLHNFFISAFFSASLPFSMLWYIGGWRGRESVRSSVRTIPVLRSSNFLLRKGANANFRDKRDKNLRGLVVSQLLLVGDHGFCNGELGGGGQAKVPVNPAHHLTNLCPAWFRPVQQLAPWVVQEEPCINGTPCTQTLWDRVCAKGNDVEENMVLPIRWFAREELNVGPKERVEKGVSSNKADPGYRWRCNVRVAVLLQSSHQAGEGSTHISGACCEDHLQRKVGLLADYLVWIAMSGITLAPVSESLEARCEAWGSPVFAKITCKVGLKPNSALFGQLMRRHCITYTPGNLEPFPFKVWIISILWFPILTETFARFWQGVRMQKYSRDAQLQKNASLALSCFMERAMFYWH